MSTQKYPATLSVDYPNRKLNKVTSFFRLFMAIPILIVLGSLAATSFSTSDAANSSAVSAGGLLFFGPLLMIVFRQKYPKWWFDWNVEVLKFTARVNAYISLMDDKYPSTDEEQSVHLDVKYPDVKNDLNKWLPLVKWFLAIPHYIALILLSIASVFVLIYAWISIIFTGLYPKPAFDFLVNVMRWNLRVTAYAFILTTDEYPPFKLNS